MSFKIRSRRDAACFIDCFEAFAQPYPLGDPAFYKFIFRNLSNDSEVRLNKYGKNDFRFKNSKMSQEESLNNPETFVYINRKSINFALNPGRPK
jgi:hypothetical protein